MCYRGAVMLHKEAIDGLQKRRILVELNHQMPCIAAQWELHRYSATHARPPDILSTHTTVHLHYLLKQQDLCI